MSTLGRRPHSSRRTNLGAASRQTKTEPSGVTAGLKSREKALLCGHEIGLRRRSCRAAFSFGEVLEDPHNHLGLLDRGDDAQLALVDGPKP